MNFASIELKNVQRHVVVQNNLFSSSVDKANLGVLILDSSNISLIQNEIKNYGRGLLVSNSKDIVVTSNLITNNSYGCDLHTTENIQFTNNTIAYSNSYSFIAYTSIKLRFQSNYIRYSNMYFDPMGNQYNTITDSSAPIISNNTFENGTLSSLILSQTSQAEISWNKFYDEMEGLRVYNSDANNITRNRFSNGDIPNIVFSQSNNNIIFMNNFYTQSTTINHITVDTLGNLFYNNNKGNYWSRYTGNDTNNDGIGETPFQIDSTNSDLYPLVDPVDFKKPNITDYQTELIFTSDENVTLNFTAYDDNPTKYDVFQNGTFSMTGGFTNGTTQIDIGKLSIGTYLFSITLFDKDDNSASFSTKVTVNPEPTTEAESSTGTLTTTESITPTTGEEEILDFISNNLLLVGGGAIVIVGSLFILLKLLRRK